MEFQVQLPQNGYRFAGKLKTRSASEIHTSNWTLGCETLDRDFANYHEYKEYLVPLALRQFVFRAVGQKQNRNAEFTTSAGWMKSSMTPAPAA